MLTYEVLIDSDLKLLIETECLWFPFEYISDNDQSINQILFV